MAKIMGQGGQRRHDGKQDEGARRQDCSQLYRILVQIPYKNLDHDPGQDYYCGVANVHVTRVLSVDWMVQPNHGQQVIQEVRTHTSNTLI